ncbi:MAG TPA: helix-turn-helix domain-containing protein [Candidatus Nanoarchaeia archaeon]|nr:helix-turn-helix domain-containing protein [Candidatus Nanoarchaeia archaeon]
MQIVFTKEGRTYALQTRKISASALGALSHPLAMRIIEKLHTTPLYPKQLAQALHVNEQTVYYHIHKLEKAGIIEVVKQERMQGIIAKYYAPTADSFFVKAREFIERQKVEERESRFLQPFIEKGVLNARLIVGSPDPHGPLKARSRDGYFGMDLALFLGTFLHAVKESHVMLDTDVHESDLANHHLIVLGGPIVNRIAALIGNRMPIYFDESKKGFYSTISGKLYVNEEIGVINKCTSPFNSEKSLLFVAGVRNAGTKAAILAFLQNFAALEKGNQFDRGVTSSVVEGVDLNADGIIDTVEIIE